MIARLYRRLGLETSIRHQGQVTLGHQSWVEQRFSAPREALLWRFNSDVPQRLKPNTREAECAGLKACSTLTVFWKKRWPLLCDLQ
jgi:hypothetical protein